MISYGAGLCPTYGTKSWISSTWIFSGLQKLWISILFYVLGSNDSPVAHSSCCTFLNLIQYPSLLIAILRIKGPSIKYLWKYGKEPHVPLHQLREPSSKKEISILISNVWGKICNDNSDSLKRNFEKDSCQRIMNEEKVFPKSLHVKSCKDRYGIWIQNQLKW